MSIVDKGPWVVNLWSGADLGGPPNRVVIQSEDFTHDVALVVSGDFEDLEQKKQYATSLAEVLNASSPNEHPCVAVVPRKPHAAVLEAMCEIFLEDFNRAYKSTSVSDQHRIVVTELMTRLYEEATGYGRYKVPMQNP